MMNAVDKYSTDIIADNEMIIAVDDVVKKDYDSAVVRIKKAIARLRDLKAMVYSNIGSSYSKMGRDKEAQRYFNDARDEYDSSSEKSADRVSDSREFLLVLGHDVALIHCGIMMQVACTGVEVPFIRAFDLFQREGEEVLVVSLELYASVRCEKQIISGKKFA